MPLQDSGQRESACWRPHIQVYLAMAGGQGGTRAAHVINTLARASACASLHAPHPHPRTRAQPRPCTQAYAGTACTPLRAHNIRPAPHALKPAMAAYVTGLRRREEALPGSIADSHPICCFNPPCCQNLQAPAASCMQRNVLSVPCLCRMVVAAVAQAPGPSVLPQAPYAHSCQSRG